MTDKPVIFIFVNGILAAPGKSDGWTDRAVTWIHTHQPTMRAEKFEYLAFILTRKLFQAKWARELAGLIGKYQGWKVVLVGHSNGCDVILRSLKWVRQRIHAIHLLAPATDHNFERNGMNRALYDGVVGRINVYCGAKDWPMKIARATRGILKPFGLSYGCLGRFGPLNVASNVWDRVQTINEPDFGHSTWFINQHFENTMRLVTHL